MAGVEGSLTILQFGDLLARDRGAFPGGRLGYVAETLRAHSLEVVGK